MYCGGKKKGFFFFFFNVSLEERRWEMWGDKKHVNKEGRRN